MADINIAWFRFYEELNDFLSSDQKKIRFSYNFHGHPSIKDAIESMGVPHPEIDLIIVNGQSVSFDYQLQSDDRVSVYPTFESLDITPIIRLRPKPLRNPLFILDVHLGKLARWMRLLGFDTVYQNDYSDEVIVDRALKEHRIILTQDLGILKRKCITHGYWVRARVSNQQIVEVLDRFDLRNQIKAFSRCLICNADVKKADKSNIIDRLPLRTRKCFKTFYQCEGCLKIYWRGSHYERMMEKIKDFLK